MFCFVSVVFGGEGVVAPLLGSSCPQKRITGAGTSEKNTTQVRFNFQE